MSLIHPVLNLSNMELLHHFVTDTYSACDPRTGSGPVMRNFAPKLGFSNTYLLHTILGISALHIQSLHSDSTVAAEYQATALSHYEAAVDEMTKAISSSDADPLALFLTQGLLGLYSLASPTPIDLCSPSSLTGFRYVRSSAATFTSNSSLIRNSPLLPFVTIGPAVPPRSHTWPEFPSYLASLPYPYTDAPDTGEVEDLEVSLAYQNAISALKSCYEYLADPQHGSIGLFIWPSMLSNKFMELLVEKRPRAWVILAHHCAMGMLYRGAAWWIAKQGFGDLLTIESVLENRWRPWLTWPLNIAYGTDYDFNVS